MQMQYAQMSLKYWLPGRMIYYNNKTIMFLNTHNQHINVLYKCKYMQTHNVATLPSESDWKGVYLADCMQTQPVIFASTVYQYQRLICVNESKELHSNNACN